MRIALASDARPVPGPLDVVEQGVTGVLRKDLGDAITSALRRAALAVSRSSVIIARMAARRQASGAGDVN